MRGKVIAAAACALGVLGLGATLAAGGTSAPERGSWGLEAGVGETPERAAGAAAEASAQGDRDDGGDGRRLVLIQVDSGGDFVLITDAGEQEDFGPGDTYLFRDLLFNARETEQVGDVHAKCTVSFGVDICWGVAELRRGKLTFAGTVPHDEEEFGSGFLLALTGGTGAYRTAGGQVKIAPLREDAFKLTFEIILLGGEREGDDD